MLCDGCGLAGPNIEGAEFPVVAGGGPAGVVEGLFPTEKRPPGLFDAGVVVPAAVALVDPKPPKGFPGKLLPEPSVFAPILNISFGVLLLAFDSKALLGVE